MTRYILNRLFQSIFVVVGVLLVVFVVLHLTGDPAAMLMPPGASEEVMAVIRQRYGLDKPWPVQLLRFFVGDSFSSPGQTGQTVEVSSYGTGAIEAKMRPLGGAIRGDFGDSLRFIGQPAMPIVLERFPLTVQLMLAAACYATVLSLVLGTLSAVRPYSWVDQSVRTFAILNQSIPNFWLALLLILVFAVYLGVLPAMGYGGWENVVLPAITLGAQSLGRNTRLVRSSVLECLSQEYVRTARAKGVPERTVMAKHVLKNAMMPVVTAWALDVANLFGGAVITESIFGWPGMGRLVVESVTFRDFPTVASAVFFITLVFVGLNLLVDLSYAWLDPRVKLA
ncbi:MAG TPA: ABC transporter permease [Methylomirabilota bacterium]|nr:ABC transporter permease [Methylomirabilota bacterium]